MRFRTRPVEIEAVRFTGDNFDEMLTFTGHRRANYNEDYLIPNFAPLGTYILDDQDAREAGFTGEVYDFLHRTWIGVKSGQWIVRGAKGEYYPCDDETFHWKYEALEGNT